MDCRCQRKLKCMPESPCPNGRKGLDADRKGLDTDKGACEWWINDSESYYCFFKFMANEGRPVEINKIARLINAEDAEIKAIIQRGKKVLAPILEE